DLAPRGAAADAYEVAVLVDDLHVGEGTEVDDDAAVVGAEAGEGVAAASYSQFQAGGGGVADACLDVPDARGPQHESGAARGQQGAGGRGVLGRSGFDEVAAEVLAEGVQRCGHGVPFREPDEQEIPAAWFL